MTGSVVGLAAAMAARRTACAFLREACAPATWAGVGLAAAAAFGFFGFSMLEGALEAVRVVTAALLPHSGVKHLGACRTLGLSGVGGWRGQDGRSDWGS